MFSNYLLPKPPPPRKVVIISVCVDIFDSQVSGMFSMKAEPNGSVYCINYQDKEVKKLRKQNWDRFMIDPSAFVMCRIVSATF